VVVSLNLVICILLQNFKIIEKLKEVLVCSLVNYLEWNNYLQHSLFLIGADPGIFDAPVQKNSTIDFFLENSNTKQTPPPLFRYVQILFCGKGEGEIFTSHYHMLLPGSTPSRYIKILFLREGVHVLLLELYASSC
jgi:hypothetical protein